MELCDLAVERAVLACVFAHGADAFTDAAGLLTAKTLTDPTHQTMWACAAHVLGENPNAKLDYPMMLSAATALGVSSAFDKPEDLAVVRATMNLGPHVRLESTAALAAKLRKLEFARDALVVVDRVRKSITEVTGDEPVESVLAGIEGPILDIASLLTATGSGPRPVSEGLREYAAHLAAHQRDTVGVASGYREYDKAIGGGFRPGVSAVAARLKTGKSILCTDICVMVAGGVPYGAKTLHPVAGRGIPALQLDTEMTKEEQWDRQLACMSGVKTDDIERGTFANDPRKLQAVLDATAAFERIPYDFLNISGQPFEETEATMRRWVTRRVGLNSDGTAKPCLIAFDYLKLMDSSPLASRNVAEFQVLGFMMTRLHNFGVKYKVPILTFVQLNRTGIDTEDSSALQGSDRIGQLALNIAIYKKKSDEEMAEQVGKTAWNRKLIVTDARHGAGMEQGNYINMMSYGDRARVVEGPTRDRSSSDTGPAGPKGVILEDTSDQESVPFAA